MHARMASKSAAGCSSAMAGGGLLPLDLSLATAGASASAGERRAGPRGHRRTVSALFAELGAMLPNDLPTNRVSASPCSRSVLGNAGAPSWRKMSFFFPLSLLV
ncbi:hypothetical protein GQ55_3G425400 [Panicum hallii var. hallii]|uniref:BHLH domain-containing protein n=1 Tax=Panicum hallii var. hallii TaxID=1504633 RepID=A0A2T7EHL9_9POAL|nr:hypothetical protein GQ55_3G425400 [Panicum hallii var. hallii]